MAVVRSPPHQSAAAAAAAAAEVADEFPVWLAKVGESAEEGAPLSLMGELRTARKVRERAEAEPAKARRRAKDAANEELLEARRVKYAAKRKLEKRGCAPAATAAEHASHAFKLPSEITRMCVWQGRLVTVSKDFVIRVWNRDVLAVALSIPYINWFPSLVEWRGLLVCGENFGRIHLYDLSGKCVCKYTCYDVRDLVVWRDRLASAGSDGIHIWDFEPAAHVATLDGHAGMVFHLGVVNGYLVSGSWNCTLQFWNEAYEIVRTIQLDTFPGHMENWGDLLAVQVPSGIMLIDADFGITATPMYSHRRDNMFEYRGMFVVSTRWLIEVWDRSLRLVACSAKGQDWYGIITALGGFLIYTEKKNLAVFRAADLLAKIP